MVPACLTAACPALRTLQLWRCAFNATAALPQQQQQQQQQQREEGQGVQATIDLSPCLQLRTLHLAQCTGLPVSLLTTTLTALPHLTSLTLAVAGLTGGDDFSMVLAASTGQLTHLAWESNVYTTYGLELPSFLTAPAVQHKLTRLQQLDIKPFDLDDSGLCAMMAHLPALKHITFCNLKLQDSHADVQLVCGSWEELHIGFETSVTSLARLPLRCIKRVIAWNLGLEDDADGSCTSNIASDAHPASPVTVLTAALAAAPECELSCACSDGNELQLSCPVSQLPALLPLLARWEGVKSMFLASSGMVSECLTPAAVGALGALLEGMPSCTKLALCRFTPSLTSLLLPALARTSVRELDFTYMDMSIVQLMLWCAGAPASCTMIIMLDESCVDGDIGKVRTAIAESGSALQLVVQARC